MPEISLTDALAALIRDLRDTTSGQADEGVDVELHLAARENGSKVTWHLAPAEDPHAHRIRMTVHPWRQPRQNPSVSRQRQPRSQQGQLPDIVPGHPDRITRGVDESQVGLDPDRIGSAQLPPIVRPKPGLDIDRDEH
ncbi:hypothetical protein ACGFIK_06745 [Micromonospora sp. NPDC048871]|uniref:hypothetical protein n=1 Tax=Micromonospora sp. NPDC048871 TaxID=3364259 RepID=UPI003714E48B